MSPLAQVILSSGKPLAGQMMWTERPTTALMSGMGCTRGGPAVITWVCTVYCVLCSYLKTKILFITVLILFSVSPTSNLIADENTLQGKQQNPAPEHHCWQLKQTNRRC